MVRRTSVRTPLASSSMNAYESALLLAQAGRDRNNILFYSAFRFSSGLSNLIFTLKPFPSIAYKSEENTSRPSWALSYAVLIP
jgi:hypothetical protein